MIADPTKYFISFSPRLASKLTALSPLRSLAQSTVTIVPNLDDARTNLPMSLLKERLAGAKPLGLIRLDSSELLLIYDGELSNAIQQGVAYLGLSGIGCYITKHGIPSRSCRFVRWETVATSYAHRGDHVLLFSPEFVEVRSTATGSFVQAIEGADIRLLHSGQAGSKTLPILLGMRGDSDGYDHIYELVETTAVRSPSPTTAVPAMWDDWDM